MEANLKVVAEVVTEKKMIEKKLIICVNINNILVAI